MTRHSGVRSAWAKGRRHREVGPRSPRHARPRHRQEPEQVACGGLLPADLDLARVYSTSLDGADEVQEGKTAKKGLTTGESDVGRLEARPHALRFDRRGDPARRRRCTFRCGPAHVAQEDEEAGVTERATARRRRLLDGTRRRPGRRRSRTSSRTGTRRRRDTRAARDSSRAAAGSSNASRGPWHVAHRSAQRRRVE